MPEPDSITQIIYFQTVTEATGIPAEKQMQIWLNPILNEFKLFIEITVRIVDEEESAQLNSSYRNKLGPTNVLAFDYDIPDHYQHGLMGDIVICAPIIAKEAKNRHIPIDFHWAHILIHGALHLLGYDHLDDETANIMEKKEQDILESLGFDPQFLNY